MGFTVEKQKDGPNFVIVDEEGEPVGDVYGTRRAAIRSLAQVQKWAEEEKKRKGDPKDPDPKAKKGEATDGDEDE